MALTKERIIEEAKQLRIEPAAMIAVDTVESGGKGFLDDGQPVILFEPHIFWKELKKINVNPEKLLNENPGIYDDILYVKWGTKPYGGASKQHERLQRAVKIDREAALASASWGRYQIMGFNWSSCGCRNIGAFINKIYKSEDEHLDLFAMYIKTTGLDDELRGLDWAGFALSYNGSLYRRNKYDTRLKVAYEKAKKEGW